MFAGRGSVLAFASLPVEIHAVEPASLAGRNAVDTGLDLDDLLPRSRKRVMPLCCFEVVLAVVKSGFLSFACA